jgi:hypothetical protein
MHHLGRPPGRALSAYFPRSPATGRFTARVSDLPGVAGRREVPFAFLPVVHFVSFL